MSKKVLIVYEKFGMGHLRTAKIIEEMLQGEDAEIMVMAGSEMIGSTDINIVVRLWNFFIRKNLIKTVDVVINFIARLLLLPVAEIFDTAPYYEKLEAIEPDIIISTADAFNKSIGIYAKEKGIPFYIFITEISLFLDLVNPYATHICYFNETGEALQNYDFTKTYFSFDINKSTTLFEKIQYVLNYYKDFVLQGYKNSIHRNPDRKLEKLNDAKFRLIGPLAEKKHFSQKHIASIKKEYGLDNGRDNVILASGSIGGKFLTEMVKLICRDYNKPLNLIAICGRDEEAYDKISKFKSYNYNNNINIIPFKYMKSFDQLLAASDCLIGRPSAGIFIESLLNKTPEITFRKATTNDIGTLTMIEKYDIGKVVEDNKEIAAALEAVLSNKEYYVNNIEKLLSIYCRTYEDKTQVLKDIIFNENSFDYVAHEDFDAGVGFNASISN
jgi:UDP-N-acetylglucosamine:LPS N-acetylglucosamine transferase